MLPCHPLEDVFADPARFEYAFWNHEAVKQAFQAARIAYAERAELGDDQALTGPSRSQCALSAFLEALELQRAG
jgi:hypothetical protein